MLAGDLTLTFYLIDYLLYYEGFVFFFLGYYILVVFWTGVCSNRGVSGVWFGSNMRKLVIAFGIGTATVFTILPFVETYFAANNSWWDGIVFGIIGVYAMCLALGNAIQGVRVLKTLRSFEMKDRDIIKSVTLITTTASTTLFVW